MTEKQTKEQSKIPAWGYSKDPDGNSVSKIFLDGELPKGWYDSPSKVK